jgi:hypothetical protein
MGIPYIIYSPPPSLPLPTDSLTAVRLPSQIGPVSGGCPPKSGNSHYRITKEPEGCMEGGGSCAKRFS